MHKGIWVAGASLISLAVGGVAGYVLAVRRLNDEYNEKMEEEIARTKAVYTALSKKEYPTAKEAAEALLPAEEEESEGAQLLDKVVKGLRYNLITRKTEGDKTSTTINVFDDRGIEASDDPEYDDMLAAREQQSIYIITEEEFMQGEHEFAQNTLTYFLGDSVLVDDQSSPVEKVTMTVGKGNLQFGRWSGQRNTVYIRNEDLEIDFEVVRSEGKYTVEVLGLAPDGT